jgi:hypothetical protein
VKVVALVFLAGAACASRPDPGSGQTLKPSQSWTADLDVPKLNVECDQGRAPACELLAQRFDTNQPDEPANPAFVSYYLTRACELGSVEICGWLGQAYLTGTTVPRDMARATSLFSQACAKGIANACEDLGDSYRNGWGADRDLPRAKDAYQQACARGSVVACARALASAVPDDEDDRWMAAGATVCPVHKVPLMEDRVPIVHGLGSPSRQAAERERGLPFVMQYAPAPCMETMDMPQTGRVLFCPECRRARDASLWHPGDGRPQRAVQHRVAADGAAPRR